MNFKSCSFGRISYLWPQTNLKSISRVRFEIKLLSAQFNYRYLLDTFGFIHVIKTWRKTWKKRKQRIDMISLHRIKWSNEKAQYIYTYFRPITLLVLLSLICNVRFPPFFLLFKMRWVNLSSVFQQWYTCTKICLNNLFKPF